MRIHYFQHVEYTGRAFIPEWAAANDHDLVRVMVPQADALPCAEDIDALIIVGGPMSIWEVQRHPWLTREKRLLGKLLGQDKPVLGICLGAQLMAEHLGARVKACNHLKIGWYSIELNNEINTTWMHGVLPERFESFFWHGDVFELPKDAVAVSTGRTDACQGFVWRRSAALQFHLEATPQWARHLVTRDAAQLTPAPYVQGAGKILAKPDELYLRNNVLMSSLLGRWLGQG
jgi:GMP synthase-like glutamine amidotransferase